MKKAKILFTINPGKALQVLLYILHKKPGIDIYNIMKVIFSAEHYHLNRYGRPVYGDNYEAWIYGPVPTFMRSLLKMDSNMPFYKCSENGIKGTAYPNLDFLSETDIEALDYGISEYGDLIFNKTKIKSHQAAAWKKYEDKVKAGEKHIEISYNDMIDNPEVAEELEELGALTQSMVL